MGEKAPCVFCGNESDYQQFWMGSNGEDFDAPCYACPGCGRYVLVGYFYQDWKDSKTEDAFKIACLVREKQLASTGIQYGVMDDEFQPKDDNVAKYLKRRWHISELLAEFPKPTELIDRALLNLFRLVQHPIDSIGLDPKEAEYLLFCPGNNLIAMLTYMANMQLIVKESITRASIHLRITPRGLQRVSDLKTQVPETKQAFVAMWFADEMDPFYKDGIRPAIKDAGFDAKRIDNKEHNNKICDEIIAEIRKSRFVVADFSAGMCGKCDECEKKKDCKDKVRPRGGVYFEAGFAMGLGIPVIWIVRKDQLEQVHFDIRQYNFISYETPEDLRRQLHNRIGATIR